jgi:hypothetical protein
MRPTFVISPKVGRYFPQRDIQKRDHMTEEEIIRRRARQLRYELNGVERGIRRYQEALKSDGMDTPPARDLLRTVLDGLIPAVREAQKEALEGLTNRKSAGGGGGRSAHWWYPILCLDAEKIAFITARTAMSRPRAGMDRNTLTQVAKATAERVRQERDFMLWKKAQNEGDGPVNMAKLMLSSVKRVDARTAKKWMKRGDAFDKVEWTIEEKLRLGVKLVHLLVEHGGGVCTLVLRQIGGGRFKTERLVELTPLAHDFLEKRAGVEELTRPWLLPMLCPPNDWRPVKKGGD